MLKFNECFKDILLCLADGNARRKNEICEFIAEQKNLSIEERNMRLEKSGQTVLDNRVGWARTYLKMAGLIEYPQRAFAQITSEGSKALLTNQKIDLNFLEKYESFRKFQSRSSKKANCLFLDIANKPQTNEITPEEQIKTAFTQIDAILVSEILDEIINLAPTSFEKLTLELLNKMGYGGSGIVTKASNDGGIDVIISEDKLGLRNIYIQAKKYAIDGSVGRPELQGFVGAIANKDGKGVFITTAKFSEPAKQCAKENHIVLIDGERLAELMIEYDIGVSVIQTYEIKRIDSDFFTDLNL